MSASSVHNTRMNKSCHVYTPVDESCHVSVCVYIDIYIYIERVTSQEMSRACPVYARVMAHVWTSHVIYIYIYIYICINMYIFTNMYIYTCTYMYICIYLHVYLQIYIYILKSKIVPRLLTSEANCPGPPSGTSKWWRTRRTNSFSEMLFCDSGSHSVKEL